MEKNIQVQFGKRIRFLRIQHNLSQETLAELTDLHRTYISSLELGNRNVSLVNIEKLAAAFSCTLSTLLHEL